VLNRVQLEATLTEKKPTRYTPAGLLCVEATVTVDAPPAASFTVGVIAFDSCAVQLEKAGLGQTVRCLGSLQPVSKRNSKLVIHLEAFE
jgi:primosomal replication protein N